MNNKAVTGCSFFPIVGLKVSNVCRMRCKFCCEASQKREAHPVEDYLALVKMFKTAGVKRICFTGGEPLLNPELDKIVKLSYENGIENIIVTSDGELLQKFDIPKEYISAIRVSLHGIGKEHDYIVGNEGAFSRINNAVDILKKKGYRIQISTVLTTRSYNEIDEIINWCLEKGASRFYLLNLLNSGKGDKYINETGKVIPDTFNAVLEGSRKKYGQKIEIVGHPYVGNAECVLIYGDGDVIIDPYFKSETHQKTIGNLFKETTSEVFDKFKAEEEVYRDYLIRLSHSTLR